MDSLLRRKWLTTGMLVFWICFQVFCLSVSAFVGGGVTDLLCSVGLDRRSTSAPSNPAAYSGIETLVIHRKQSPIILFQRPGSEINRLRHSKQTDELRIQPSPMFSFPSDFVFPMCIKVSDWHAVQAGLELMKFPSLWELDEQEQSRFLNLFADVIERVPFELTGRGSAVVAGDRYALKLEQFLESSAYFTRDATYRFTTETGNICSLSMGKFLGGQRLPTAIGMTIKHISKQKDLTILDISQGVTEFITTGNGMGFDLAVLVKLSNSSNFGVIVENVCTWLDWGGLELDSSGVAHAYSKKDKESLVYRIGFSDVSETRMLAADVDIQPDAVAADAISKIALTYGTRLMNDNMSLNFSGSTDVKRRLALIGGIDYKYEEWGVGMQFGSADFFNGSVTLGLVISKGF